MLLDPMSAEKPAFGDFNPRFLPPGMTMADYASLTQEQQIVVQQQMMQAQAAYAQQKAQEQEELMMEDQVPEQCKKAKAKRINGLLEWITEREGHEFLVAVDRQFIKDKFNLIGLHKKFCEELNVKEENLTEKQFGQYLKHLYKSEAPTQESLADEKYLQFVQDIVDVYGMIHNRYIRTPEGLSKMFQKYLEGAFGNCPRALCDNQKCIPVGLSEKLRNSRVKIFCPKCDEVYMVQKAKQPGSGTLGAAVSTATNLDGSYFGCSFPQIFLTTFDNMIEQPPKVYLYEPKICGFNIVGKRGSKYYNPQKFSAYKEVDT